MTEAGILGSVLGGSCLGLWLLRGWVRYGFSEEIVPEVRRD